MVGGEAGGDFLFFVVFLWSILFGHSPIHSCNRLLSVNVLRKRRDRIAHTYTINAANVGSIRDLISQKKCMKTIDCKADTM